MGGANPEVHRPAAADSSSAGARSASRTYNDGRPVFHHCELRTDRRRRLDINARLRPDIVILDEAQRIKNWSTKTAQAVKRLASRYAFVLTGTPIENRIDELRSIVDFLDPAILGPLFRFNREYYELDEKGPSGGLQKPRNCASACDRSSSAAARRRRDRAPRPHRPQPLRRPHAGDARRICGPREASGRAGGKIAKRRPLTQGRAGPAS